MHSCDNCKAAFDSSKEGVVTTSKGRHAAAICGSCTEGARKIKIVLCRGDLGGFSYEQYSAIEMATRAAG